MSVRHVLVAFVLLGLGGPLSAQEPLRRDSAGVELVMNRAPVWAPGTGWRLSTRPVVTIGGPLDGEELWGVRGFLRVPDGRYAVLSAGHFEVRLFDDLGRLVGQFGRVGDGPGEFAHPMSLALSGPDTVLVMDRNAIERFLLDGTVLDPLPAPRIPNAFGPGLSVRPYLVASDRSMVGVVDVPMSSDNAVGVFRPTQGMALIPGPGAEPVYLGRYEGALQERVDVGGGRSEVVMLPFATMTMATIDDSRGGRVWVGDSDRYDIHQFNKSGSLQRIIHHLADPVPVEPEWIDEWLEVQRGSSWVAGQLPRLERAWSRMSVPETLPAFEGLAVDDLGNLWVTRPRPSTDRPVVWDVFDSSGQLLGPVEGPAGVVQQPPPHIGEDYIMLLEVGAYGVEMVRVYALDRGR